MYLQIHIYTNYFLNRNGGNCYHKCNGPSVLVNLTSGALGSHTGSGVSERRVYCMWLLTVFPDPYSMPPFMYIPTITFTMHTDLYTECGKVSIFNYIYIPGLDTNSELLAPGR